MASVAVGVNESEAQEAAGVSGDDPAQFLIRLGVIAVEGGNHDSPGDASSAGAAQILVERRDGVPGGGETVTFSGVAVAVDDWRIDQLRIEDHRLCRSVCCIPCALRNLDATAKYQMLVAMAW